MLKSKKIIAIFAIVFLLITLFVQVKATSDNPLTLNDLIVSTNTTDDGSANATEANSIVANQEAVNAEAANSVLQPATNTNTSGGNTLPQTGVTEDITVMFFIIVCVISAIYAYKKIRDYNV